MQELEIEEAAQYISKIYKHRAKEAESSDKKDEEAENESILCGYKNEVSSIELFFVIIIEVII